MKIAIFGRWTENTDAKILVNFFGYVRHTGIQFAVYGPYLEQLMSHFPLDFTNEQFLTFEYAHEIAGCQFVYSFGGDGTVLECVRLLGPHYSHLPILGVNFGRLGYLTSVLQTDLIAATESLQQGHYSIDSRRLLSIISEPLGVFGNENFGLNDVTIHKSNTNEMITVHVYVNGEFLNSYKGDGLIIATPTGSTAYSLACGGPIIFPSSENFIITPVAPHSLTVRPVVIPDSWVVSCQVVSRSGQAMLALDARTELIQAGTSLAVRKANFSTQLVRLYNQKYIRTLRQTLMWGTDARK